MGLNRLFHKSFVNSCFNPKDILKSSIYPDDNFKSQSGQAWNIDKYIMAILVEQNIHSFQMERNNVVIYMEIQHSSA